MAVTNARLLGALIGNLSPEVATGLIKSRVLTTHFTKASVLALNAVLLTSPEALAENMADDTVAVICQGIAHSVRFFSPSSQTHTNYLLSNLLFPTTAS
jgi:hypothetical protein